MWERIKTGDPMMLAGIAGSMFALIYTKSLTPGKAVCAAIGGTGAAIFLSPALASGLAPEFAPAISFLVGIFSMSIIGIIFQVIERMRESSIKTLSQVAYVLIDVLLAFRHGTPPKRQQPVNDTEEPDGH